MKLNHTSSTKKHSQEAVRDVSGLDLDPEYLGVRPARWTRDRNAADDAAHIEVYLQAKKYTAGNTVGENNLRNFAGAIDSAGTSKGVFVTTAGFTRAAKEYVARSPKHIVLIDGEELARLMVKHDIGVRRKMLYEVKRIDEGYFDSEDL